MTPSAKLLELAHHYIEIVDSGDETRQGDERTAAHDEMMAQMQAERIPFNARYEARWIARWMLAGMPEGDTAPRLMWAKLNPHTQAVTELFFSPPNDNKDALTPVMVVMLPFVYQPFVTERNV